MLNTLPFFNSFAGKENMSENAKTFLCQLWTPTERSVFISFFLKADRHVSEWRQNSMISTIQQLKQYCLWKKKQEEAALLTQQAIEILRNSTRGQRTVFEKDILKKFIMSTLTCIPYDKLISSDIDCLCNEIDWVPQVGKSILFLQGDFGNVYYMIAKGHVELYLESSKDKEMVIAREFGHLRGQPYKPTTDLSKMGVKILTLNPGSGFGEFAILNAKQKLRSCAAVSSDDDSLLLILHADTYNAVIKKLHNRQRQLTLATALLQELPLFKQFGFSKISSVAYTLKSVTYSSKSILAKAGDPFNRLYLIVSGEVRVICPNTKLADLHRGRRSQGVVIAEKHLPSLSFAQIGRGIIIGETEAREKKDKFEMTYLTISAECEVFEMPVPIFLDILNNTANNNTSLSEKLSDAFNNRQNSHVGRLDRAYMTMKDMILETVGEIDARSVLSHVLPNVITNGSSSKLEEKSLGFNSVVPGISSSHASMSPQRPSKSMKSDVLMSPRRSFVSNK